MSRQTRTLRQVSAPLAAHGILVVAVLVTCVPLAWMLAASLEPAPAVHRHPAVPLPWPVTLANFAGALREFLNTALFAVGVTAGQLALALPAGYALARRPFPGAGLLLAGVLASLPVPFVALYLPNYVLVARLGLVDTYVGMIVPQLASGYSVFLLRQHFSTLPQSMFDAARLDGAGEWQLLWRIAVPASRPAVAALAVLLLITSWNEYIWPSLVAPDPALRVLAVGVTQFQGSEGVTRWGPTMAAATLASLPTALAYLAFRRHVLAIVMQGAVKG
jgi:ABC-type glycerol-3-phosphate transport system permease component